LMAFTM